MNQELNTAQSSASALSNSKALVFDTNGIAILLDPGSANVAPIPVGVFTRKGDFRDLIMDSKVRAKQIVAHSIGLKTQGGNVKVPHMVDAKNRDVHVSDASSARGTIVVGPRLHGAKSYFQLNDAPWYFSPDGSNAIALRRMPLHPNELQDPVDLLMCTSLPFDGTTECPEAVNTYMSQWFEKSKYPHRTDLYFCENCKFMDGNTGERHADLLVFKTLKDCMDRVIGIVGVVLDKNGAPITGDGVTSGTHFLKHGYGGSDVRFPEINDQEVGIAVDLHSALRLEQLTGLRTVATGSYSVLSALRIRIDDPLRVVLVERDGRDFHQATKYFMANQKFNPDFEMYLASFTSLGLDQFAEVVA